jgi:hypothetical protein
VFVLLYHFLQVLNNALSESGSLHATGGRSVRTAGSLFILQLQQQTRKGAAVTGASSISVEEQEFQAKVGALLLGDWLYPLGATTWSKTNRTFSPTRSQQAQCRGQKDHSCCNT